MRIDGFAHDVGHGGIFFVVHAFNDGATHAGVSEAFQVRGNVFNRLLAVRHALEKSANLVCHLDQVVCVHIFTFKTSLLPYALRMRIQHITLVAHETGERDTRVLRQLYRQTGRR